MPPGNEEDKTTTAMPPLHEAKLACPVPGTETHDLAPGASQGEARLVPGRACGDCSVCCVALAIDHPEIEKAPGIACRHCTGAGCATYATRPSVCRTFYCTWRTDEELGDHWRPDRSGVLVCVETEDIPDSFERSTGIVLLLVANPLVTIRERWLQDFVTKSVMRSTPIMLALGGPRGSGACKILLNTDEMLAAIARGTVQAALERTLESLQAWHFGPVVLTHRGHDVRDGHDESHRHATHRERLRQPTFADGESAARAPRAWVNPVMLRLNFAAAVNESNVP